LRKGKNGRESDGVRCTGEEKVELRKGKNGRESDGVRCTGEEKEELRKGEEWKGKCMDE